MHLASKGNTMKNYKTTHAEYLSFFHNWLHYQFGRQSDRLHNVFVFSEVKKIVADDDDLQHWANRDCWSMYYLAEENLKARAIVEVTA